MRKNLFKVILPVFLVILGAVGIGTYYMQGNMAAVAGYFSATCAWLIVTAFNTVNYIKEREYLV